MADLDLWIAGDSGGTLSWLLAKLGPQQCVRVSSADHMVATIAARLGPQDRIRSLLISDHGHAFVDPEDAARGKAGHGIQAIGGSFMFSWDPSDGSGLGPSTLGAVLAPLRRLFAPAPP